MSYSIYYEALGARKLWRCPTPLPGFPSPRRIYNRSFVTLTTLAQYMMRAVTGPPLHLLFSPCCASQNSHAQHPAFSTLPSIYPWQMFISRPTLQSYISVSNNQKPTPFARAVCYGRLGSTISFVQFWPCACICFCAQQGLGPFSYCKTVLSSPERT